MLRATGRYADAWFPVGIFSPEQYADGLQQVQTAADNANRDPHSIIAANTQFVVTGRSSGEVEEALDSVLIRAFALNIPAWAWAEHGAQHPLGESFGGFQDILPQTFDEQTVLAHAAAAPISLIKQFVLTGTPDEVIDRPKGYFPVPAIRYLHGPFLERVRDALCGPTGRQRGLFRASRLIPARPIKSMLRI